MNVKLLVILVTLLFLLTFGMFSFYFLTVDPHNWSKSGRMLACLLFGTGLFCCVGISSVDV